MSLGLVQITPQYFQMTLVHMGVVQNMRTFLGSEDDLHWLPQCRKWKNEEICKLTMYQSLAASRELRKPHCACNQNQSSIGKRYSQILMQFCALSSDLVFSIEHLIIIVLEVEIFPKILGSRNYHLLTTWPGATVEKNQVAIVESTSR